MAGLVLVLVAGLLDHVGAQYNYRYRVSHNTGHLNIWLSPRPFIKSGIFRFMFIKGLGLQVFMLVGRAVGSHYSVDARKIYQKIF